MFELLVRARFLSVAIVAGLVVSAAIMIFIGGYDIYKSVATLAGDTHDQSGVSAVHNAKTYLLEAVDSFLLAMVMFFFAFGTFFLLVDSTAIDRKPTLPDWLKITSVGQLKKTLLEVVVVFLAILFTEEIVSSAELDWTLLVYPAAIVGFAIALKLISFDH